jgi:hypothetical protein
MNKLYIDNNYIVAEITGDGAITIHMKILGSLYTRETTPDQYSIVSQTGSLDIEVIDIPNWYDETGTVAYTEETLVTFLRTNTGA